VSSIAHPPLRVSALWTLASTGVLFANPWGSFGWPELLAAIGPLALALDHRIRPGPALAVGIGAIALLAFRDVDAPATTRTLVAAAVFAIGVALGARAFASRSPMIDSIAERGMEMPSGGRAVAAFKLALERELGRARRHGQGLVVLSIAVDAQTRGGDREAGGAEGSREPLRPEDEDRAVVALRALLARELRLYSDVVADRGRVLALVPEVGDESFGRFVKRLHSVLERGLDFGVRVGIGWFPKDAVSIDGLIDAADESRVHATASRARTAVHEAARAPTPDGAEDRSREVPG